MDKAKISKGHIKSSAGAIQVGAKFGTVYIAEGPETGASIAMADPKATVLISFGLSNIKNLGKVIKSYFPSRVIIAGDNDNQPQAKTLEITKNAQEALKYEGVHAEIIIPSQVNNLDKTDWNDVLKQQGISEVKTQLGIEPPKQNEAIISQKEIDNIAIVCQENQMKQAEKFSNSLKESYLDVSREEARMTANIDKAIQTKIADYSKEKTAPISHQGMDAKVNQKKEMELEI